MRKEYDRRRKLITKRINEIKGCELKHIPEGAFYIFPKIIFDDLRDYPYKDQSSEKFSLWLLEKTKIITIPGVEFGYKGEGFVRLSYATSYEKIDEAMDRLEKFLGSK
jgi:aspartate/methionine/tyrosine aminotransferase